MDVTAALYKEGLRGWLRTVDAEDIICLSAKPAAAHVRLNCNNAQSRLNRRRYLWPNLLTGGRARFCRSLRA
jgi:hypothetical protein